MTDSALDPLALTFSAPSSTRHDSWTAERQRLFIAALAQHSGVARAARAIGMTPQSAKRLRRRAGAEDFARRERIKFRRGRTVNLVNFQHLDTAATIAADDRQAAQPRPRISGEVALGVTVRDLSAGATRDEQPRPPPSRKLTREGGRSVNLRVARHCGYFGFSPVPTEWHGVRKLRFGRELHVLPPGGALPPRALVAPP